MEHNITFLLNINLCKDISKGSTYTKLEKGQKNSV